MSVTMARTVTMRFSTFGIVSVGKLLVTGSINTWYLAGSVLVLLSKVVLFFGMVAIAAVNRLHFTPKLVQVASAFATQDVLRQLRRNTAIECVVGIIIICIVAVLGVTPHGSNHFH